VDSSEAPTLVVKVAAEGNAANPFNAVGGDELFADWFLASDDRRQTNSLKPPHRLDLNHVSSVVTPVGLFAPLPLPVLPPLPSK